MSQDKAMMIKKEDVTQGKKKESLPLLAWKIVDGSEM